MIEKVKISYGILDQTIGEDNKNYSVSSKTIYCDLSQTLNSNYDKDKLTYLENDYFLLDGTFKFPDNMTYDLGYESLNLSDSQGFINEYVEYQFENEHDSYGIQIYFRTLINDFTIEYYNGGTLLDTISITNNSDLRYTNKKAILGWNKVKIGIYKIANVYQRARISNIVFGINDDYDENYIMEISASKTTSINNDNSNSSEVSVSFFNEGRFDINNLRDLPVGLQSGAKLSVYFNNKLFNEYIVDSTKVDDEGYKITLEGYDKLYYANDTFYGKGKVYSEGRTLYDWAIDVANDGNLQVQVDDSLKNIISKGYIGFVPHREALRMICEASNSIMIVEEGIIKIVQYNKNVIGDISDDEILEDTFSIENDEKCLGVKLTKYNYVLGSNEVGLAEIQDIVLTGENQEIEVEYSSYPSLPLKVVYKTDSSMQIISQELYSDRAKFVIKGNKGDTSWITILGKNYTENTSIISKGFVEQNYKEIKNTLITETDNANSVLDFQFTNSTNLYTYGATLYSDKDFKLLDATKIKNYNVIVVGLMYNLNEDENSLDIVSVDNNG